MFSLQLIFYFYSHSIVSPYYECFATHGRLLKCGAAIDEIMETLKYGVDSGALITYTTRGCQHALKEFTAGSALSQGEIKRIKPIDKIDSKE